MILTLLLQTAASLDLERIRTEKAEIMSLVNSPSTKPIANQQTTDMSSASAMIRTEFFILKGEMRLVH